MSLPGHRPPTCPLDVSEYFPYVKCFAEVNHGKAIVGGVPLPVFNNDSLRSKSAIRPITTIYTVDM